MRTKTTIEKNKKATSLKMKSILFILLAILGIIAESNAQNIPSYIPTNGLVGWWPFNGNANDESGNGNDGTVNGATLTTDRNGILNSAYSFDGIDDVITSSLTNPLQSEWSITFWYKSLNVTSNFQGQNVIGLGSDMYGWGGSGFQISGQNPPGQCPDFNYLNQMYFIDASSECGGNFLDGGSYTYNTWKNVVIIKNNLNYDLIVNNVLITSSILLDININQLIIGNRDINFQYFNGNVDDVGAWNRALTPQEISNLYTASSTNNNVTSNTTANVPGAISYQAVARDAQGMPLADTNLQVRFTLIADSLSGTAEYVETHTLSTNSLGLFTTAIGAGNPVSNTFGNINWSAGNKFLKVQIDTGNGWIDMGTQQLLSTPYSMHSATSGAIKNPGLPVFADNAAALAGGLVAGDMYRTASGDLKIVY